ncbi:MAG: DMT family transporter [Endozoicomonas sp.]
MHSAALFLICAFVWGGSWYAITFQLGSVDPLWSISYRFLLASAAMVGISWFRKAHSPFTGRQHIRIAIQGMCGTAFWLVYLSELYITSALSALVCTTVLYLNVIIGRVWLGNPVRWPVVTGGVLGSFGIALLFLPELWSGLHSGFLKGVGLAFAGCIFFSIGSLTCEVNKREGLPLLPVVTLAMFYSALFMIVLALLCGKPPAFQWSLAYVISLIYLALFGSILAMASYMALIGRIGADKTAYVDVVYPIVALGISTLFEGYQWTPMAVVGVGLVVVGNLIAMSTRSQQKQSVV